MRDMHVFTAAQENREKWVTVTEEMRSRQPSESDLKDIRELRDLGYKPAAIASGLELNKKTVNRVLRKLG
jgi:hypothetical protein